MKKKIILISTLFLILLCAAGCKWGYLQTFAPGDVDDRWSAGADSYEDLGELFTAGSSYTFLLFTDIHFGKSGFPDTKQLLSFIEEYNKTNPEGFLFTAFMGDLSETGAESEYQDFKKFEEELLSCTGGSHIITVPGNHDFFQNGLEHWKKYCYPHKLGYRFGVKYTDSTGEHVRSFYGSDTTNSNIGSLQYEVLKAKIEADSNKKFMFTHEPIHQMGRFTSSYMCSFDKEDGLKLQKLLLENKFNMYLSGHIHDSGIYARDNYLEYCFRSYTRNYGVNTFYTVTINEETSQITVKEYDNLKWSQGPRSVYNYNF